MKYCVKCGNELIDEAVFCTKCGVMVGNSIHPIKESVKAENVDKSPTVYLVFGFISNILSIVSAFFLLLSTCFGLVPCYAYSVANSYANSTFYEYSKNVRTTVNTVVDTDVYAYWFPNYSAAIWAVIFSIITFICSVCCLIVTLIKHGGIKDIFSAITKVLLSLALGLISFIFIFS